jgi:hypothetical protein
VGKDTRPIPSDEELNRAVSVLDQPDADETAVDAAFCTLVSLSPSPVPPRGFARRVAQAVRRAPLAEGRRSLARPLLDWPRTAAWAAAVATVTGGFVAALSPLGTRTVIRIVEFFVRGGLSLLASVDTALRLWNVAVNVGTALAEALASPPIAMMLMATALVSGLSVIALIQLLSTEQESLP